MNQLSNAFSLLELDVPDDKEQTATDATTDHRESANERDDKEQTATDATTDHRESANERGKRSTQLSNAFSLLELDVADDKEQMATDATTDHRESANEKGKGKKKGDSSGDKTLSNNENGVQQSQEMVSGEYKLPLVWIDLEMTGLDIEVDRILEIACIITDGYLTKMIEGPDLVIHQSKECLDRMGEWCQSHHGASGLTEKVLQSTISEQEAEQQVIEFVKGYVGTYMPLLAGNSVYVDLLFLKKYMPDLASLFSHVLVDVSSIKALCLRWYPKDNRRAPSKENKHRAMDDIKESIAELKYYKENIFKSKKSKK